jgi:ornithine decarboxylase
MVIREGFALRSAGGVGALARTCPTPALLLSRQQIRANLLRLREALPGVALFYAIKANPHPAVLETVAAAGVGFEISSTAELELALATAPPSDGLVSFNPVKTVAFLKAAWAAGLRVLAADSVGEIEKIARYAPGSRVAVRLAVDNSGSEWPLARKFGVGPAEAGRLLDLAATWGLDPTGLTFHVGSQCLDAGSWSRALEVCRAAWQTARRVPDRPGLISLGGGFPIQHLKETPDLPSIGARIVDTGARLFGPGVPLSVEPGRAVVGDAAQLVTSVIGVAERAGERWVHLDAGVFNALMETIDGFSYRVTALEPRDDAWAPAILAGPSCDSVDVISQSTLLPTDLRPGDRLVFANAGAYTLSYASHFNGFPPPVVLLLD